MAKVEDDFRNVVVAGDLREGGYVMLKNRPCKIEETSTFDRGKHGNAKVRLVGIDLFTGEKYEDVFADNQNVDVPNVRTVEYEVVNANNSYMELMNPVGEPKVFKIPDSDVGKEITTLFENGGTICGTIYVYFLEACGEEMAVSVMRKAE